MCILYSVISSCCNLPPVMQAVDGLSPSSSGSVNPNDSSLIYCHVLGAEGKKKDCFQARIRLGVFGVVRSTLNFVEH